MNGIVFLIALSLTISTAPGALQRKEKPSMKEEHPVILAVGAHAGDMEVTCGAVLAKHVKRGDRVVILHLTLGEGGNPNLPPEQYAVQKRREAEEAAKAIGAEVIFGPYKDGELPNDEKARQYVSDIIRQVKPTHIITHWKHSIHKDHAAAHAITVDAILLASLEGVKTNYPRHRGVKKVYFTENWEDREGFHPYIYVNVSDEQQVWEKCVRCYEFIRGGISRFPYLDYYKALARVRGAESGFTEAVAFDVDPFEKKQVYDLLP